jgi:hypothetical protein
MAEFLITAPDGKKYKVTGATRDGALAALKRQLGTTKAPQQQQPNNNIFDGITDSAMRIGQGIIDLPNTVTKAFTGYEDPRLLVPGDKDGFLGIDWSNIGDTKFVENTKEVQNLKNPFGFTGDEFDNASQFIKDKRKELNYSPTVSWEQVKKDRSIGNILAFMGEGAVTSLPDMVAAYLNAPAYFLSYIAPIAEKRAENDGRKNPTPEDLAYAAAASLGIATAERFGAKGVFGDVTGNAATRTLKASGREGITEGPQNLIEYAGETVGTKKGFEPTEALDKTAAGIVQGTGAGGMLRGARETAGATTRLFKDNGDLTDPSNMDPESAAAAGDFARRLRTIADANGYDLRDVDSGSTKGARETVDKAHIQMTEELKKLFRDLGDAVRPSDLETFQETTDKILAQAAYREARNKTKSTVGQQEIDAMRRLVGNTAEGQQALNLMLQLNQLTEVHNQGYKGGFSRFTDVFNPIDQNINSYDGASRFVTGTLSPLATFAAGVSTGGASLVPQAGAYGAGRAIDKLTGRRSRLDRYVRRNESSEGLPEPDGPSVVEETRRQKALEEAEKEAARVKAEEEKKAKEAAKQAEKEAKAAEKLQKEIEKAERAVAQEAQRQKREAEDRAADLDLTRDNAPPTPESPQFTMQNATGLNRDGVAKILRILKSTNTNKSIKRSITEYEQSVASGGRVSGLNRLIRRVRAFQEKNPDYVPQVRPPNSLSTPPNMSAPAQPGQAPNVDTQTYGPRYTTVENYNRGIQNNLDANRELSEGVVGDPDLNQAQKGQLLTSLDVLANNLGSDPVATAEAQIARLQEAGVPQDAIDAYVKPYVDRVIGQQAPRQSTSRLDEMEADSIDQALDAVKQAKEEMEIARKARDQAALKIDEDLEAGKITQEEAMKLEAELPEFRVYQDARKKFNELDKAADKAVADAATDSLSMPALQSYINPLEVPDSEIGATSLREAPTKEELEAMRNGTFKPKKKRVLIDAAEYMHQKWKEATGRDEPFEYTPENVDIISTYMATEAVNALQNDTNAIGWYDRKLKAAKRVVSIVDPRVTQSPDAEAAFDFALSVTSNGQAVADNFQYALEVFRHFMDNGVMPTTTWKKGGERNNAMAEAFEFFNTYQASGQNTPIQEFLDLDFTVNELKQWADNFNSRNGTQIKVPSSEGANAQVKGSYIIGPKIGQGFYQNIRGNYDPLTMDIWWMRMWNRLVGRPFVDDPNLPQGRQNVKDAMKGAGKLEQRMINQTLKDMGVGKREINKDPELFDQFVTEVEKRYQKFYKDYKQKNGKNHNKPDFFKKTGTHVKNLKPQLQAQPKGPNERAYMRQVTKAAIDKLRNLGYDITTADFQALMWYPEKQLFRKLGVAPGRGADNDYLDAAIMLAESEGITNDQIQEALPDPNGDGEVNNQSNTPGTYETGDRGADSTGEITPSASIRKPGLLGALSNAFQGADPRPSTRRTPPGDGEIRQQYPIVRAPFEVGKPGTDLENGIKNIEQLNRLAEAYNVNLIAYRSQRRMLKELAPGFKMDPGTSGLYNPGMNTAGYLVPGAKRKDGGAISANESFITAVHELAHAVADKQPDGSLAPFNVRMFNRLTNEESTISQNSFDYNVGLILGKSSKEMDAIRDEIIRLQDKVQFTFADGETMPTRDLAAFETRYKELAKVRDEKFRRKWAPLVRDHRNYVRNINEMAVDPLSWYLFDPKAFKREAPKTAKMMREFFNEAGAIKFYNHPLAMGVAVILAMLMQADQDDEQKRMMPPGALNQPMQAGALSA